ncbi:hypothetical protein AB0K48_11625 [Nonomuraea sp. NPDC055795]
MSAHRVSLSASSVNMVLCAMKYDCSGSSSPSASSPMNSPRPRNSKRLNANAAAEPSSRIRPTVTVVTMTLLSAYEPMPPTSHASAHLPKSSEEGSAKGLAKICGLDLKLDATIQISGRKNATATAPSRTVVRRFTRLSSAATA